MARLRFPGRPGCRFGRLGVRYGADEAKNVLDPTLAYVASIHRGLLLFRELFGDSDEEEEFEGFTRKDVADAERKLKAELAKYRSSGEEDSPGPKPTKRGKSQTRLSKTRESLENLPAADRTRNRRETVVRRSYKELLNKGGSTTSKPFIIRKSREVQSAQQETKDAIQKWRAKREKGGNSSPENIKEFDKFKIKFDKSGRPAEIIKGPGRPSFLETKVRKSIELGTFKKDLKKGLLSPQRVKAKDTKDVKKSKKEIKESRALQ